MKTLFLSVLAVAMTFAFVGTAHAAKEAKGNKGVFVSLAEDGKSIKMTTGGKKNPQDVTVQVDDKTKVTVDGAESTLKALAPGQMLSITPASGTATMIEATAGKKKKA